jgi:hypothetical protein
LAGFAAGQAVATPPPSEMKLKVMPSGPWKKAVSGMPSPAGSSPTVLSTVVKPGTPV